MASLISVAGEAPQGAHRLPQLPWRGLAAGAAWLALAGATRLLPEDGDFPYTAAFAGAALALALALPVASALAGRLGRIGAALSHWTPWLTALALAFLAWELVTAKSGLLPMPFFPPPQAILEVFLEDWPKLGGSILASLKLLLGGYLIGASLGFAAGVAIGWSKAVGYWAHPVLRFVGPLPATAWLPLPAINGFSVFLGVLGDTFTYMMLYAAPFIAVLLFLEFGFAVLGLYSPQLQVSTLATPVKCLAGLGILLLYFPLLQDLIVTRMAQLADLKHSIGLMFQGVAHE